MGKKIKGAKHRTVRYPEQQKRLRELKLYHKINNPPKVIDDQEIPKSVRKIKEFKEKVQTLEAKYERKQKEKKMKKVEKKTKEVLLNSNKSNLLQRFLVQESGEETIVINNVRRVNKTKPAETIKPHIPVSRRPVSKQANHLAEQSHKQKQRKLLSELSKEYPSMNIREEKDKKHKRKVNPNKRLNKREKDKLKQKQRQEAKEKEVDLSAPVYDKYAFGEIVHAPPKLLKRPRNTEVESKPGKKQQNLLLASMLNPNLKPSQPPPRKFNYNPDLSGKRRDLSVADRRRLDKEQASAIAAYKKMKAERWRLAQGK